MTGIATSLPVTEHVYGKSTKVDNAHRGNRDYDIFIRANGTTEWIFGVTVFNPGAAMEFQAAVRARWPVDVKVMAKPKRNPYGSLQ